MEVSTLQMLVHTNRSSLVVRIKQWAEALSLLGVSNPQIKQSARNKDGKSDSRLYCAKKVQVSQVFYIT